MRKNTSIELDINKNIENGVKFYAKQFDDLKLKVKIFDGVKEVDVEGQDVIVCIVKEDKTVIEQRDDIAIEDNTLVIDLSKQATTALGKCSMEILLRDEEGTSSTSTVSYVVGEKLSATIVDIIQSEDDVYVLNIIEEFIQNSNIDMIEIKEAVRVLRETVENAQGEIEADIDNVKAEALTEILESAEKALEEVNTVKDEILDEVDRASEKATEAVEKATETLDRITGIKEEIDAINNTVSEAIETIETTKGEAIDEIASAVVVIEDSKEEAVNLVSTTKTNAISSIVDEKAGAINEIGTTKVEAVSTVADAGATSVGEVNTAKVRAVEEVENAEVGVIAHLEEKAEKIKSDLDKYSDDLVVDTTTQINELKTATISSIEGIKADTIDAIEEDANEIKLEAINTIVNEKDGAISEVAENRAEAVRAVEYSKVDAIAKVDEVKDGAIARVTELKDETIETINGIKDGIVNDIETAKIDAVAQIVENKETGLSDIDGAKTGAISQITGFKDATISEVNDAKAEAITEITGLKEGTVSLIMEAKTDAIEKVTDATEIVDTKIAEVIKEIELMVSEKEGLMAENILAGENKEELQALIDEARAIMGDLRRWIDTNGDEDIDLTEITEAVEVLKVRIDNLLGFKGELGIAQYVAPYDRTLDDLIPTAEELGINPVGVVKWSTASTFYHAYILPGADKMLVTLANDGTIALSNLTSSYFKSYKVLLSTKEVSENTGTKYIFPTSMLPANKLHHTDFNIYKEDDTTKVAIAAMTGDVKIGNLDNAAEDGYYKIDMPTADFNTLTNAPRVTTDIMRVKGYVYTRAGMQTVKIINAGLEYNRVIGEAWNSKDYKNPKITASGVYIPGYDTLPSNQVPGLDFGAEVIYQQNATTVVLDRFYNVEAINDTYKKGYYAGSTSFYTNFYGAKLVRHTYVNGAWTEAKSISFNTSNSTSVAKADFKIYYTTFPIYTSSSYTDIYQDVKTDVPGESSINTFDDAKVDGAYAVEITAEEPVVNAPIEGELKGILNVSKAGSYTKQEVISETCDEYVRIHNGQIWTEWKER